MTNNYRNKYNQSNNRQESKPKGGRIWGVSIMVVLAVCILAYVQEENHAQANIAAARSTMETTGFEQITPTTEPDFSYEKTATSALLDVPYINQQSMYPNGCESVSAVMALDYLGLSIDVDDFIDNYLELADAPYIDEYGEYVGGDPRSAFLGDPRSDWGWGCESGAIYNALNELLQTEEYEPHILQDISIEDLTTLYIDNSIPVLIWATINMEEPYPTNQWRITGTDEYYTWLYPLHCLVLTGYDEKNYYFNDPMIEKNTAYEKDIVQSRYESMGSQAIAIVPSETDIIN